MTKRVTAAAIPPSELDTTAAVTPRRTPIRRPSDAGRRFATGTRCGNSLGGNGAKFERRAPADFASPPRKLLAGAETALR
jgi:hypothetical protein